MKYNWQQQGWPNFTYDLQDTEASLLVFAEETAYLSGILKVMPEEFQFEAIINLMVSEAIKTSEIEGEYLSRQDVISSIRNNLNPGLVKDNCKDKRAQGAGELMVAVRDTFSSSLTKEMLFKWHKMLMGAGASINTGSWPFHTEPMQIVSGRIGKENIHFEAPPSKIVATEMTRFIEWFNATAPDGKQVIKQAPVRSAIAHLYFESIHPFEDGNGRIGRAIAEKALSQTIGRPVLLSLSQTIEADKKSYYNNLEKAQRSNDITVWIKYFLGVVISAQLRTKELIDFTLAKAKLFDRVKVELNIRQIKVLKKMLASPEGFEGGMSAQKYISITRASKATATRDLQELAALDILMPEGAGRNTRYVIKR